MITDIIILLWCFLLFLILLTVLARLAFLAFVYFLTLFDKPQKQGKELEEEIDALMEAMK